MKNIVNKKLNRGFFNFCCDELNIKEKPKVILTDIKDGIKTSGYYDINNKIIKVYIKKRHPMDYLRTLAHELVHHMQNEKGSLKGEIQDIGGSIEDEANCLAGVIMKKFGYNNPILFEI